MSKPITPFRGTDTYLVDPSLATLVDLAVARQRPLLITGEAGTGKTQLAYAIAGAFNTTVHHAQMTSTMEGEEVCYVFDSVLRLTDSQIAGKGGTIDGRVVANPMCYVRYGAVGRAFTTKQRTVVLLDEIDKTNSDVQDDLLRVLDSYEFEVREANQVVKAGDERPIFVITSNGKRELSDPFLRRCYAYHIAFPTPEQLTGIVRAHYPTVPSNVQEHAVAVLYELRAVGLEKPPATSELLEWVGALLHTRTEPPRSIHAGKPLPFPGVLLKRGTDLEKFRNGAAPARRSRQDRLG